MADNHQFPTEPILPLAEYAKTIISGGWNILRLSKEYLQGRRGGDSTELTLGVLNFRAGWPQIPKGLPNEGEYGLPVILQLYGIDGKLLQGKPEHPAEAVGFPKEAGFLDNDILVASFDVRLLAFLPQTVREELIIAKAGSEDSTNLSNPDPSQGEWQVKPVFWIPLKTWFWTTGALSFDKKVLQALQMNVTEQSLDRELVGKQLETTTTWIAPISNAYIFADRLVALSVIGINFPINASLLFPEAVDEHGRAQHPIHWVMKQIWEQKITGWGELQVGVNGAEAITQLKQNLVINPLRRMADAFYLHWQVAEFEQGRLTHKAVSDMFSQAGKTAVGKYTLTDEEYSAWRKAWWEKADAVAIEQLRQKEEHGELTRTDVLKAVRDGLFMYESGWPQEDKPGPVRRWVHRADRNQLRPILVTYNLLPRLFLKEDRREEYQKKIWTLFESGKISRHGLEWGLRELGIWKRRLPSEEYETDVSEAGSAPVKSSLWFESKVVNWVLRISALLFLILGLRSVFTENPSLLSFLLGATSLAIALGLALVGGIRGETLLRGIIDLVDIHIDDFVFKGFTLGVLEASWAIVAVNIAIKTGFVDQVCSFGFVIAFFGGWILAGMVIRRPLLESSLAFNQLLGLGLLIFGVMLVITGVPFIPDLSGLLDSSGGVSEGTPVPTTEVPSRWRTVTPTP